jgi:hypothetical protein
MMIPFSFPSWSEGNILTTAFGPIPNIFVFLLLLRAGQGMLENNILTTEKIILKILELDQLFCIFAT